MMSSMAKKTVMLTRLDSAALRAVTNLLSSAGIQTFTLPWDQTTIEKVQQQQFDVVVIGFPVAASALSHFLAQMRIPTSASQHSGVILLSQPDEIKQGERFLGRGVNRLVALDVAPAELLDHIKELTQVAPRVEVRASARITVHSGSRPLKAFCQTVNLSSTGMLLRGFAHYPQGTALDFEITIPGESEPIRGTAKVLRTANAVNERVEGVGARFESFQGYDRDRLQSYLERTLSS
jgi:DNA-binding response OmpR family regulator